MRCFTSAVNGARRRHIAKAMSVRVEVGAMPSITRGVRQAQALHTHKKESI